MAGYCVQTFPTDIFNLSLCSKALKRVCATHLKYHKDLYTRVHHFDGEDAKDHSKFPWHKLLLQVLRHEIPIPYVVELSCAPNCPEYEEVQLEPYGVELPFSEDPGQLSETRTLINHALRASPWIEPTDVLDFLERIMQGDEDPVLSLLVPYLYNLRAFRVPIDAILLQSVIRKMSTALTSNTTFRESRGEKYCLPRLVLVTAGGSGGIGIRLEDLAIYATIPSVRRLVAINVRSEGFEGWPNNCVTSNAEDVYFPRSSISMQAITGFVKGFRGPCIFRQLFSGRWSDFYEYHGFDWDHCEVSIQPKPVPDALQSSPREETIETRYPDSCHEMVDTGPNPGPASPGMMSILDVGPLDWRSLPDVTTWNNLAISLHNRDSNFRW